MHEKPLQHDYLIRNTRSNTSVWVPHRQQVEHLKKSKMEITVYINVKILKLELQSKSSRISIINSLANFYDEQEQS